MRPLLALTPLLALGACVTSPATDGAHQREVARLDAECSARGGTLAPAGNRSGRSEPGYICNNADATRITR